MVAAALLALCIGAFSSATVSAIRFPQQRTLGDGERWTQQLYNHRDVQYHADAVLGSSKIKGILDTGSFELVAFSKNCASCYQAGQYDEDASPNFDKGRLRDKHRYGSGWCITEDGTDSLSIGSMTTDAQDIWVSTRCRMRSLRAARFNAIIGVGPVGHPQYLAYKRLLKYQQQADKYTSRGRRVPTKLGRSLGAMKRVYALVNAKKAMLDQFGVTTFSECVEKEPLSPGWFTWNDATREGQAGVTKVEIEGNMTWTAAMSSFKLGSDTDIACENGCAALLDTGTSLIGVGSVIWNKVYNALMEYLEQNLGTVASCRTLEGFPDLNINIGGQTLSLPPSAYLGTYYRRSRRRSKIEGDGEADMEEYDDKAEEEADATADSHPLGGSGCKLLMMNLGNMKDTAIGPMVIFGLPFFRNFYTTFTLGNGTAGSRAAYIQKNPGKCQVDQAAVSMHEKSRMHDFRPMSVDPIDLRGPSWIAGWDGRI